MVDSTINHSSGILTLCAFMVVGCGQAPPPPTDRCADAGVLLPKTSNSRRPSRKGRQLGAQLGASHPLAPCKRCWAQHRPRTSHSFRTPPRSPSPNHGDDIELWGGYHPFTAGETKSSTSSTAARSRAPSRKELRARAWPRLDSPLVVPGHRGSPKGAMYAASRA